MAALRRNIGVIVGAIIAFCLHIVVSPAIAISFAQPNVIFAFCAVLAIVRPGNGAIAASFVLGLFGGFVGAFAPGLMAAVCVCIAYALSNVFEYLDTDSAFMPVVTLCVAMLVAECLYGFLLTLFGLGLSFTGLLLYRVLPCALYDCVVGFLLYPLVHRFIGPAEKSTVIPVAMMR